MTPLILTIVSILATAAALAWYRFGSPKLDADLAVADSILSPREQALIAASGDAFFPAKGPIPISGSQAGAVKYFDGYLRRAGTRQRILMRLLFVYTELSPIWFGPQRRRFSRLTLEHRIEFLETAFISSIYFRRIAFTSLRALLTMAYLSNGDIARAMGMRSNRDPFALSSASPVSV